MKDALCSNIDGAAGAVSIEGLGAATHPALTSIDVWVA
jgi:hypothetical protein